MAITVKHKFVSAIPDAGDPNIVQPSNWNDDHELTGTIPVSNGGTGASTLTGYVKGNGTAAMTASATVPSTDITGLGTMSTQNSNNISVTGGSISGTTVAGYVPTSTTITAGTGLTGGGDLSANRTLAIANTAVTAAAYGSASKTLTATVNAQGQLTALADTNIAIANTQVSGLGTASTKDAGAALGVATLDASGKVPVSELPAAVLGALSYQGTWDASTNTPTLTSSVGTKGYYYVVSVAGSTNLNGITDWLVGDWAVYNGTVWQKVDNTDAGGDVVGPASATDNAVARFDTTTGKLIQNSVVTVDDTGAVTGVTTLAASTSVTTPIVQASNSGGLALRNSAGTTQISMGGGGGDNVSINVATNINGANAQIDISPTGTGHVHIKPTGTGSLEIAPTNVGTINNMTIGATTPRNASVVDLSVTGTLSFDAAQGTAGQVLTSAGTGATPTWTTPTTGTVTSVAATAPSFLSVAGSPITTSGTLALTYSGTALPVANGGTGRTVGNYSIYANEIHVGKDGNDTTGDGTLINPVLTITQALTLVGAGRNTVIVHPGSYSESPTVSSANTTIATAELTGANTQISGTLTLSAAARVSGIKISNLTITGSGNIYISNCTVDTQVVKSGTNYVEIINSELQCVSGIQITGAGIVSIVGNKCWAVAVSNASANVLIKDCFQVLTPSVTAGNLQIDGSAIFAASPASNAVTSSVGSFITLANSFILNSAGTNVERVSLAGFYSILNLVYDKTNSTFTGTNLNAIDYFSVINADTLVLTNDLAIAYGGTNSSATPTAGAVPYGTGTAYAFSAAGTAGQVLTSQGAGTPTWTTPTTGTVTSVTGTAPVVSSGGNTPAISMAAATGSVNGYLTSTDWTTFNSKGNGTVTSVGGTGTVNGITLTGTVTSSGSLTLGGTLSGVSLSTQVSGTLPIANGGTGETTRQAAMDALAGAVTSGQYLRGNGTDVVMSAIQAADVPTLNQNTTGTAANVTGTVAIANGGTGATTAANAFNALSPLTTVGDILYEETGAVGARLPIGTTGQVLTVSGGKPAWGTASSSNITSLGLYENSATIGANYTIGTGNNAMSAGPITISSGFTVTVPTGSVWTVI